MLSDHIAPLQAEEEAQNIDNSTSMLLACSF
jgi:hypothetical protein